MVDQPSAVSTAAYDVAKIRAHFPALRAGVAHFDSPGGTQVPDVVADAVASTLTSSIANRGSVTAAERAADQIVIEARSAMGDLLGVPAQGIVFGRSMTQLTYDVSRAIAKGWGVGDEVVVTRLDHDGNVRPWVQAAEAAGATVRWADFDPVTAELTAADVQAVLTERTRLVAVTGASNLLGTRPPVAEIAGLAHSVGALCYVDGVHLTAHCSVDFAALGADFYACSPYKFLGPHCGVVAALPEALEPLRPDKLVPSSDAVPERFELGTLPYELLAGTTAAVDFLAGLGTDGGGRRTRLVSAFDAIEAHEDRLRARIEDGIADLPGVLSYSQARLRTPTMLLGFTAHDPVEAYQYLAGVGVNAPASSFYAIEASRRLGLGDNGALRVGLAPYSDDSDVNRLLDGLRGFLSRP